VKSPTVGHVLDALAASNDRTTLAIAACAVAVAKKLLKFPHRYEA
jgi:hypothetical protein